MSPKQISRQLQRILDKKSGINFPAHNFGELARKTKLDASGADIEDVVRNSNCFSIVKVDGTTSTHRLTLA